MLKDRTILTLGTAAVALVIIAALAGMNWRLAALAALTAGAIALTRLRYAAVVAVAVLVLTFALAHTGRSAGTDDRDLPARAHHR